MPAEVLLCLRTRGVRTTLTRRHLSFTPNGDGLREVGVVQIQIGKPKPLKIVSLEPK